MLLIRADQHWQVGVSLVFIWWWFPRAWARGNAEEQRLQEQEMREREAYMANVRAQQAVNRPRDEETGEAGEEPPSEAHEKPPPVYVPQKPAGYQPPVTPY
jgi:hypothetical protein